MTEDNIMVKMPSPHNHAPDIIKIELNNAITEMKETALKSRSTTNEIISIVMSKYDEAVKSSLKMLTMQKIVLDMQDEWKKRISKSL